MTAELQSSSQAATATRRRPISAGRVLAWGGTGVLLYVAHTAFIPVALALLFALVLSGPVEALHRRHVPRSVGAALILISWLSVLGGAVDAAWVPAQEWFAKAPQTVLIVEQKVSPIAKFMDRLDDLRKNSDNLHGKAHAQPTAPPSTALKDNAPLLIMSTFGTAMAGTLTFLIVTMFLLAGGPVMLAKLARPFTDNLHASYVLNLIEKVREEVGRYYLTTTFINLGLGAATTLAMWAWGMPTPLLWGTLAATLNYIPYAGPGTTLLVITLVALVSLNTLGQVFGVAGSYLLITLIEGQVVQPLTVGRRMDVNPLLIFLALWFGGLFWGVAGIVLATPTLVALKVIAKHTENNKPVLAFLSPVD